jgi:hypothetical protein
MEPFAYGIKMFVEYLIYYIIVFMWSSMDSDGVKLMTARKHYHSKIEEKTVLIYE